MVYVIKKQDVYIVESSIFITELWCILHGKGDTDIKGGEHITFIKASEHNTFREAKEKVLSQYVRPAISFSSIAANRRNKCYQSCGEDQWQIVLPPHWRLRQWFLALLPLRRLQQWFLPLLPLRRHCQWFLPLLPLWRWCQRFLVLQPLRRWCQWFLVLLEPDVPGTPSSLEAIPAIPGVLASLGATPVMADIPANLHCKWNKCRSICKENIPYAW